MNEMTFDDLEIGDLLPAHEGGPISRHDLALYCGASGDHNPIHVDIDAARRAGQSDVFAHGMLSMAYLAQLLTAWVPQEQIREFGVRFVAITPVHARVRCTARVADKFETDGERRVRLSLDAHTDAGLHTLAGEAIVALA
ncbi:MAG TPA: MaoC family dehydratase [Caulobacteraceae bacterium]|jgi:acyl dehydratase|nr:MaoC family dehydratase [Caulobacteraceae bacterium]